MNKAFSKFYWMLSIVPKISEISIGIEMKDHSVSVSTDRNIRDHLRVDFPLHFGINFPQSARGQRVSFSFEIIVLQVSIRDLANSYSNALMRVVSFGLK